MVPRYLPPATGPQVIQDGEPAVDKKRWWGLVALCLAVLIVMVDNTIVNVALPSMARALNPNSSQLTWLVDAYVLVFAGLLLTGGYLGDRFGRKKLLIIGMIGFSVVSVIAGEMHTPETVILFRGVMGVFGAMIFPATLGMIANMFLREKERALALAIWSATSGVSVAIGPVVGGALVENFWWGSVFFINAPLGALALLFAFLFLKESKGDPKELGDRFDYVGAILSFGGVSALVFGLIQGPHSGWFSISNLIAYGLAVVMIAMFIAWSLVIKHPILEVRLFTNRLFASATVLVSLAFFGLFGFLFTMTIFLQAVKDYGPLKAGVALLPFAGVVAVCAPIAMIIAKKFGPQWAVSLGLLCMGSGFFFITFGDENVKYLPFMIPVMILLAMGLAFIQGPATDVIMGSLPPDKAGAGSAVNDTTREIGGTIGIATFASIVTAIYGSQLEKNDAGVRAQVTHLGQMKGDVAKGFEESKETAIHGKEFVHELVKAGFPKELTDQLTSAIKEAYCTAMIHSVWIAVVACWLGAVLSLFLLRPPKTLPGETEPAEDGTSETESSKSGPSDSAKTIAMVGATAASASSTGSGRRNPGATPGARY